MPRNVVNIPIFYGIAFILLLSIVWLHVALKKKAIKNYLHASHSTGAYTIYEKCRWIFNTGDISFIMQTLAHVSYKEHTTFLKAYVEDSSLSDLYLKTVILFKTASLYKEKSKRMHFFNMLSDEIKKRQLLLQIAATHCPEIIPTLYSWLKIQSKDYLEEQVSAVYSNAINNNNPLLFDCLLEYDIPLHPKQASEYLTRVLTEKKHQAFVCLLIKAGAELLPSSSVSQAIGNHLIAFQDAKSIFYKHVFPLSNI